MTAAVGWRSAILTLAIALLNLMIPSVHADPVCPPLPPDIDLSNAEWKNGCPVVNPSKKQGPQESCRSFPVSTIEVDAPVSNPPLPRLDRTKPASYFRRALPKGGFEQRYAETMHYNLARGQPILEPFTGGNARWKQYPSRQGKYICLVLHKVDLAYNPVVVYIASDFSEHSCSGRSVVDHETQHYEFLSAMDSRYAALLAKEINKLGLPTPSKPLMVKAEDAQLTQKRGDAAIGQLLRIPQRDYLQLFDTHRRATDSKAEYQAIGANCQDWPRVFRRR